MGSQRVGHDRATNTLSDRSTARGSLDEGTSNFILGEVGIDIRLRMSGLMWTSCAL